MDRFISPEPLPTPYEQELLTILMEECNEAAIRASKMKRFGVDEVQPGQGQSNMDRLMGELGDILGVIQLCQEAGLLGPDVHLKMLAASKVEKVKRFLQSEAQSDG